MRISTLAHVLWRSGRIQGGSAVVTTTLQMAAGGQILVGGPTTPSGRLILALTSPVRVALKFN